MPVVGQAGGNKPFQWPDDEELKNITADNIKQKKLKLIEWAASGSLWSLRLKNHEDQSSDQIGKQHKLEPGKFKDFGVKDKIEKIIMHPSKDEKYVQGFVFFGQKSLSYTPNEKLIEVLGVDPSGHI